MRLSKGRTANFKERQDLGISSKASIDFETTAWKFRRLMTLQEI
jgi:hypothetical protein